MKQYNVTGMSCAACQARVEKAVNLVDGVSSCSVSLLTNSMGVEGTASPEAVIKAVEEAGYGASLKIYDTEDTLRDTETPAMMKRLIMSLILLLPLMYVSMGYMMWDFPVPEILEDNALAIGIYEMILALLVMIINRKFFINGFAGIIHGSPNMDTLVALGSMAAFAYSIYAMLVLKSCHEYYYESAAMILTLITVGKMLEARSKGKTTDALKALMKLTPKTAVVYRDDVEVTIPANEVKIGDRFVVKPGEQIPVDGIVVSGFSAVNEAAFTGESVPVDKNIGDSISAATININGFLVCEATRVGEDTSLSKIIQMVSDAAATKAPIAKIADKVSGIFVPTVMIIALITFIVWMVNGHTIGYALARAISVLVISCPCALGLATPVAIMVGNGIGARSGILFKTAKVLEQAGRVSVVALDKTGTITSGNMQVTDVVPTGDIKLCDLISLAASLEAKSEHPISKAITDNAKAEAVNLYEVTGFQAVAGNGLSGVIEGEEVYGGNADYIENVARADISSASEIAGMLAAGGKTPVYFAKKSELLGIIAVADTLKPDSKEAIRQIKELGLKVVMLTGDNEITAHAIAKETGIDDVVAAIKPEGKEKVISSYMEKGKVAYVGDGINDAPALTRADVGIAIGAGTDIAIDAADIVLAGNSLVDVAAAIRISRATIKNIYENLFWAFIYNIIGIPLAAGCFIGSFGWTLNPMFGAAAMSLSSFCVVMNALRLNLVKIYDTEAEHEVNNIYEELEETTMKITVNGMMCPHCEAHVKESLEKIDGIEHAAANHEDNTVELTTSKDIAEADIRSAIESCGYEYDGICS